MSIKKVASSLLLLSSLALTAEAKSFTAKLIKVDTPLSMEDKEKLYCNGIDHIVYAGNMSYYLYGDERDIEVLKERIKSIISIEDINSSRKVGSGEGNNSLLQSLSSSGYEDVNILFLGEMSKDEIENYFAENGIDATLYSVSPELHSAKARVLGGEIEKISKLPLVQYIDKSHTLGTKNAKTAKYIGAPTLWGEGYNLHGEGMRVAVVDGGYVRKTHREFGDRVIDHGMGYADHATHVAGTIAAAGYNEKVKGIAYRAHIDSYSFEESAFADKVLAIYKSENILFSNHSYGYSEMTALGEYDSEAAKQDRAVYANPFLNIFEAAGNDGAEPGYPAYGKIKGPANSKNILTIGALNINSSGKATFSSNGPAKDGRVKPDLVVRGEGIYSTGSKSDDDYFWMNGTSMATPAATASGLLVAQAYKNVTGGYDIRHDILKSVLINSAIDKGRRGPDYDTGYGMIELKGAIDTIHSLKSTKPLVLVDSVINGEKKEYAFKVEQGGKFKATISWVDPAGDPATKSALVDDLDIYLVDSNGKKYYPWTLNPTNPSALAKRDRENHIDNIEQIEVDHLGAGNYKLVVKGSRVIASYQDFAIASNISISKVSNIELLKPSRLQNFATVIKNSIF